jgi:hypothetical protein
LKNLNDNSIDLFPCYSWNLVKFFDSKGLKYKLIGLHPNSLKKFWVYIRTEKLNKLLDEWKETKV